MTVSEKVAIEVIRKLTDVCDKIGQCQRDVKVSLQVELVEDEAVYNVLNGVALTLGSCISLIGTSSDAVVEQIYRIRELTP